MPLPCPGWDIHFSNDQFLGIWLTDHGARRLLQTAFLFFALVLKGSSYELSLLSHTILIFFFGDSFPIDIYLVDYFKELRDVHSCEAF